MKQSWGRSLWWFARRSAYRLSLLLGICCVIEVFVYSTDGTNPNTRLPLEWYVPAVSAFGLVMFGVAWLAYTPAQPRSKRALPSQPRPHDPQA